MIIGATGSGKSELLRTLVWCLTTSHSVDELNLVLIDFKGGATFAALDRLPHTSAVITNLADTLGLVDRAAEVLQGELVRRQELLRDAGNLASVADYRAAGNAPLPSLVIICDEFSELLAVRPDFIDVFLQIGRLGRSLGVHLILASQRVDEGRLRGLETHLSYRIALRANSTADSRSVLGVPDAYELPSEPGHGYFKRGTETLRRFRAGYVSGPRLMPTPSAQNRRVVDFRLDDAGPAIAAIQTPAPSLLAETVDRLSTDDGPRARQIWLPPLNHAPSLSELPRSQDPLLVPVGLVDVPAQQRRDPYSLDLRGAAGHVAIVGGPRSGKTTAVHTIVAGLADAHVYCLDFTGELAGLETFPQVGGVATEAEQIHQAVAQVAERLVGGPKWPLPRPQEPKFMDDKRGDAPGQSTAISRSAGSGHFGPPTFLVIDGWASLRQEYPDLEDAVLDLATRGLSHGVHLVITANRWADLRPGLRDLLGSQLELRLGDPLDSAISRAAATAVPADQPGRGLAKDGHHLYVARPDLPPSAGPQAPPIRLLPRMLPAAELEPASESELTIGVDNDLVPVMLDPATEPYLLVFGERGSGKTSLLRLYAHLLARSDDVKVIVIDYRRRLSEVVPEEQLLGYATNPTKANELLAEASAALAARRHERTGPDLFVLVDDYDLVAGPDDPLRQLLDLLPHATDIGLHLALARRSGGAARAMFDPVLQSLAEIGTTGVVLSADPDDGPLLGVRTSSLSAGRARLTRRSAEPILIQLAWVPPD